MRQFTTLIRIRHRVDHAVNGAPDPTYEDANPALHSCDFKHFFGAEAIQAGQLGITEGGTVSMWYTPGIKASDRILLNNDENQIYEVIGVENIENRNMYLILKVKRVVSA
jgi:hypothetical protein